MAGPADTPRPATAVASDRRSLSPPRVALAWLLAVGVDLLANAGVFAFLFDQDREPALLDDRTLFARIPVGYACLALAVTALAWLLDRSRSDRPVLVAGLAGLAVASWAYVGLWTAIDLTLAFVAAAMVTTTVQAVAAGLVLTNGASPQRLARSVVPIAIGLFIVGQIVANLTA